MCLFDKDKKIQRLTQELKQLVNETHQQQDQIENLTLYLKHIFNNVPGLEIAMRAKFSDLPGYGN